MKRLLTAALMVASLLSAQAASADQAGAPPIRSDQAIQPLPVAVPIQPEQAAASGPAVITWDRVGSKEKWWA